MKDELDRKSRLVDCRGPHNVKSSVDTEFRLRFVPEVYTEIDVVCMKNIVEFVSICEIKEID